MDLRYKQLVQCSAEGCVTSHQTHSNARKHTQTHRKHTQTHANARKHTQTQTANTRKHSPIAKTAIPVQQIIERRPPKKNIIHKFHS